MGNQLLLVDDDVELCELLGDFLSHEGFDLVTAHDGRQAVTMCRNNDFDIVILDVMLPGIQGFEVLRKLREFSTVPVIMLTARGEDTDRIVGLELGADDYLPKPCNPRELAARLRAILRRADNRETKSVDPRLIVGELVVNPSDRSALLKQKDLALTTAEFNILFVLLDRVGMVVSKEALNDLALRRKLTAYDRSVDVHISSIRKKIAAAGGDSSIKTIRGVGYQYLTSGPGAA
jgi:DNA-binding response OmpR family regulator